MQRQHFFLLDTRYTQLLYWLRRNSSDDPQNWNSKYVSISSKTENSLITGHSGCIASDGLCMSDGLLKFALSCNVSENLYTK